MAVQRLTPYTVGETAKLWPKDEQEEWCHVKAPDGQEWQLKRTPPGPVKIWLLQAGEWSYSWKTGDEGVLTVLDYVAEDKPPPQPTRWPAARGV